MRDWIDIVEGVGKIVKGVNTTPDVDVDQTSIEAEKFGFDVDENGYPPVHKYGLNEAWEATVNAGQTWGSNGNVVDVYRNPNKREVAKIFRGKKGRDRDLRALITTNGDLLVWDADFATHDDIENHYHEVHHIWLYLDAKEVLIRHLEYQCDEEGNYEPQIRTMVDTVKSNKALRRLYGDFTPVGENADMQEYFLLDDEWLNKNIG